MRRIFFITIIVFAGFIYVSTSSETSKSVSPLVKPEVSVRNISSEKVEPKEVKTVPEVATSEAFRYNDFWDEVQERWTIDFQDLLTRLDPEKAEALYTRYIEARKAYGNEITSIVRLRSEKGLKNDEINKLMDRADQEYEEILKTIFGKHYAAITAQLEVFHQEIQNLNNDGDYEIGIAL